MATRLHDRVYRGQSEEHTAFFEDHDIPKDLTGTLLRNGPGILKVGDDPLHYFDGHGMIAALSFRGGRAVFRNRHVRTELFELEQREARQARRRIHTNMPRWRHNLFRIEVGNPAAHDVYSWGGKILASDDLGHYALAGDDLRTLGPERWGGAAPAHHKMAPMPRVDLARDRLVGYTIEPGVRSDIVTILELDRGYKVRHRVRHELNRRAAFIHDIAFTENYYILFESPLTLDPLSALMGRRPLFEAMRWQPDETPLATLVPREPSSGRAAVTVPVPRGAQLIFHIINAFESAGEVVIDAVAASGPIDFRSGYSPELRARDGIPLSCSPPSYLYRYTVDPERRALTARKLSAVTGELPEMNRALHGRPYSVAYLASPGSDGREPDPGTILWFHELSRIELDSGAAQRWHAGPDRFVSQPAFAQREGAVEEDDGYLLAWVLDAQTEESEVVILDARSLEAGPIARVPLGLYLPMAHHGRFFEELTMTGV